MARHTLYLDDDDQIEVRARDGYSFVQASELLIHVDKHDASKVLAFGEALVAEAKKHLRPYVQQKDVA